MKMRIRNISYMPEIAAEGTFICSMPSPPPTPEGHLWYSNLKTYERLFYHQTLSSVRQSKRFRATPEIPRDSLDYQLQSRYDHSSEIFPDKVDSVLQKETCVSSDSSLIDSSFRVLRNTVVINIQEKEELGHPLKIGGIIQKMSPHSVKLINSGPHNQLVNNGFSRQPADGNFFRY